MRRIAALLLACFLCGPAYPQETDSPLVDRGFLERCLGEIEEFPMSDGGTGWEANVLIFVTALTGAELLKVCQTEPDAWVFVAAGAAFLVNEFRYMREYKSRSEELCREVASLGKREAQIAALEKAALNKDNAAKALMDRSNNYEVTAAEPGSFLTPSRGWAILSVRCASP